MHELRAVSANRYVPPVAFAIVYAGLGKMDDAFHWLEKAVEERDGLLIYLRVGSAFDNLRSDRRFPSFLARVGLQGDPGLDVAHPASLEKEASKTQASATSPAVAVTSETPACDRPRDLDVQGHSISD